MSNVLDPDPAHDVGVGVVPVAARSQHSHSIVTAQSHHSHGTVTAMSGQTSGNSLGPRCRCRCGAGRARTARRPATETP